MEHMPQVTTNVTEIKTLHISDSYNTQKKVYVSFFTFNNLQNYYESKIKKKLL